MSSLTSYFATYPQALAALVLVCGTSARQIVLWADARSAVRRLGGRPEERNPGKGGNIAGKKGPRWLRGTLGEKSPGRSRDALEDVPSTTPREKPTDSTSRMLAEAGLNLSRNTWIALRGGAALAALLSGIAANAPLAGIAGAALVIAGTRLWLASRIRAMESELEKQVLQLEMQMAENSRSGLSVERSLRTCLEHADQPLKGHLERIVNELVYSNRTLSDAFASFAANTKSQDVAILASVISVQQETGSNLADTLDFLSQTIEEKQRMRMTLRSRIAEMGLTKAMVAIAPLIIVAMCCLLIEGVADFYATNPLGWMLLAVCGTVDVLGVLLLGKMSSIPID